MYTLQMEELEPRQLLNSAGFVFQSSFAPSGRYDFGSTPMTERAPLMRVGGDEARPVAATGHGTVGPENGLSQHFVLPAYEHVSPQTLRFSLISEGTWTFVIIRTNPTSPAEGQATAPGPDNMRNNTPDTPVTLPAVADTSHGANAAAAEVGSGPVVERPSLQPSPRLDTWVGTPAPRLDSQSISGVRLVVVPARERDSTAAVPEPLLWGSLSSPPRSAPAAPVAGPNAEPVEEGPAPVLPRIADVLPVLPPFELSALERGIQRFLGQLEQFGENLTGRGSATGWYLWVVAGAAAVAACEIGRRQLRQPLEAPALAGLGMAGALPGLPGGGRL
jgi:hypothetical protein